MSVFPYYRLQSDDPKGKACTGCGMRGMSLFGALDDCDLDRLHVHISDVELPAGGSLYKAGDAGSAVFTLRSGIVRFERVSERGERRIVRLAGCGDLLGQEVLLERNRADDAIACTPVALCRIPAHVIDSLGTLRPALVRELMQRWQQALEDSHAWVAELGTGPARRRVLKLLHKLSEYAQPGAPIWLPKREEIGDMLHLTIETASRQISQLRREGVLAPAGSRRVAQIDVNALREALLLEDTNGA